MASTPNVVPEAVIDGLLAQLRLAISHQIKAATKPPSSRDDGARLLTVKQAAQYINRTESAMRQILAKRIIPVIRFDRLIRIDRADLDRFIDDNRV